MVGWGGILSWTITSQYLTPGGVVRGEGFLAGQSPASISHSEGGWSGEDFLTEKITRQYLALGGGGGDFLAERSPDSISHLLGGLGGS